MSSHCLVLLKKAAISSTLQLTSQVRRMFFVQQLRTATPFIRTTITTTTTTTTTVRGPTNRTGTPTDRQTDRQRSGASNNLATVEDGDMEYQGNTQDKNRQDEQRTHKQTHTTSYQTCRFARVRTLYVHQHHHSTPVTWGGHRTNVQAQTTNNERRRRRPQRRPQRRRRRRCTESVRRWFD